ncbi:condensation domain-containing protein [Paenibacillus solani]|uniref:condensation domain-containing protein n=1 Tax=Paenibacillus solani TaxID=1705565 RepID=UPI003D28F5E0
MTEHTNVHSYSVTPQDRMNYLLGVFSAVQQIGIVMKLSDQLDTDLFMQAVRLTIKKYPILSCRFVEDEVPYWEKFTGEIEDSILKIKTCTREEEALWLEAHLAEPMDWITGPMVQATLFRSERDVLCIKISHLCSDAAGLKEYTHLIASLYTRLHQKEPYDWIENELLGEEAGFRDQGPLFEAAGIADISTFPLQEPVTASLWSIPSTLDNLTPAITTRTLGREQMMRLISITKANGATVNDGLLAAYFRSIAKQAIYMEPRTIGKAIGITVNLRRYLPNRTTGTLCNLSAIEVPVIEMDEKEPLDMTLHKAKRAMDMIKENKPGISSAVGLEKMASMPLSSAKAMLGTQVEMAKQTQMALPLLTNLGVISESSIHFGDFEVEESYMTAPIMYSPFFSVGASTYQNTLTLSVGYHTPAVSENAVSRLLDDMISEFTTNA